MESLTSRDYRIISTHEFAEVRQQLSNNQKTLVSLRNYRPGKLISEFTAGIISNEPTYLTVQIDVNKHITLQPEFLQYINHSCDPNVFFNTATMQLVVLKPIHPEDEFTFFYPSAEWRMAQSFQCNCRYKNCIGEIKGAAFLSPDTIKHYQFTEFIKQQLAQQSARKKVA